jgi:D-glycero-D-manno-heptose 1,7-bisphosphate phosphatase
VNKAVFLDRDGVINPLVYNPYTGEYESPHHLEDYSVYTWTLKSLRLLQDKGFYTIVISNQPDYAKGKASMDDIQAIEKLLRDFIEENSCGKVLVDDYYYCYHHPKGIVPEYTQACRCRKPGTLFVEQAIKKYNLDVKQCFFIGDRDSDIQCGRAMGIFTIKVNNIHKQKEAESIKADLTVNNLYEAARRIV